MTIKIEFKNSMGVRLEGVHYFCVVENDIFLQVVFNNGKTNYYKIDDIIVIEEL